MTEYEGGYEARTEAQHLAAGAGGRTLVHGHLISVVHDRRACPQRQEVALV